MSIKQKEVKFKPRIKLNHNIYIMYAVHCKTKKAVERWEILLTQDFLPWSHNKKLSFWHKSFICHLHISQNTPCLPPELLHNLGFYSSWVFEWSKGKLKTILMQNFGGQTRCIMGGMHTVNWQRWFDQDGWMMALFFFVFLLALTFIRSIKMQIKRTFANIQPSWPHDWSVRASSSIEIFTSWT